MVIGDRLRALREQKKLTQRDIERRCGLLCCYVSRAENGHSVPSLDTLEKWCQALEVPLYQLFYDGEESPALPNLPKGKTAAHIVWRKSGRDARLLYEFCQLLNRMHKPDRQLLLLMAQKMAGARTA